MNSTHHHANFISRNLLAELWTLASTDWSVHATQFYNQQLITLKAAHYQLKILIKFYKSTSPNLMSIAVQISSHYARLWPSEAQLTTL